MADDFVVLTICAGNLHRSALADALLTLWSKWYLPPELAGRVRTHSAGLVAPVGEPMSARVQMIAAALGADGSSHAARRLTDADLREADLVLTASRRLLDTVLQREPAAVRRAFTIREAGRIAESLEPVRATTVHDLRTAIDRIADRRSVGHDDDIIDPEGRGDEAYAALVKQEVPPLVHLAEVLYGMPKGDVERYLHVVETGEGLPDLVEGVSAGAGSAAELPRSDDNRR
ncbi:MAG: hypothetical protein ACTHNQ_09130 [Microbacterium sp.]|uniref:arsenate reductase/protein-tyrosine-phosphatase family protein n=1 Tax=Microbacterium sp. TaxID=51671 RepID=UPI003F7D65AD